MQNKHKNKRRSVRGKGGAPAFHKELMDLAARMAAQRMPLPLKDDGSVFADRLQILFFDLKVPGEVNKDLKNAANWCKFIDGCTDPEVLDKLGKDASWKEEYKVALKAYMKIAAEERAWAYHLSTDRAEADYRNGLILAEEKGEKKGRKETRLETARNMLADGLSHEKIALYTNLPLEEVEKLAAER